jgi:hypothetical protein
VSLGGDLGEFSVGVTPLLWAFFRLLRLCFTFLDKRVFDIQLKFSLLPGIPISFLEKSLAKK